jgi:hypothetical protein
MPARRLPLLVTRRSAPRHERRPTPATSTRVSHFAWSDSIHRVIPRLVYVSYHSHILNLVGHVLTFEPLVLKQVHPDTGISNRAMSILNSFVNG